MRSNLKVRKNLYFVLIILLVLVASLSVAYAALSVTLNITGNAEIKNANWSVKCENVQEQQGSVVPTKKTNYHK